MTRPTPTALALCLFQIAAPALADQAGFDMASYDRILDDLGAFSATGLSDWTETQRQEFATLRAQLDTVLQADPYHPAAADWFGGMAKNSQGDFVGWYLQSPATLLEIARGKPLPSDLAQQFAIFISLNAGYDLGDRPDTACLAQRAMVALRTPPPTDQDIAFLNAVQVIGQMQTYQMRADNFARASELDGGDPATLAADPAYAINDLESQILYESVMTSQPFSPDKIRQSDWLNYRTFDNHSPAQIDQAIEAIAATDLPGQIERASPYFDQLRLWLETPGTNLLTQICN